VRVRGVADDGAVIEITVIDGDGAEVDARWPPVGLRRDDDGSTAPTMSISFDPVHGADRLESDLALFAAERLDGLVAVHAAMIVHHGRAIVVPGRSHAGKTTLALAALDAGMVVTSDEYALVDPTTGLVHGWPRPLRIRLPGGGIERRPLPDHPNEPVPVAVIAAVRYEPGGAPVGEISRADAVMALLDNCVCGALRPSDSFEAALAITAGSTHVGGTHDDAAAVLAQLTALV
jgi:hypothetical protein